MTTQNPAIEMEKENIVPLFKQSKGNASVVLPNGRVIMFAAARFFTEEEELIHILTKMAKTREAGIFIDPEEPTIDTLAATPMEQERKRIRKELIADFRANPQAYLGVNSSYGSGQPAINVASTVDVMPEGFTVGNRGASEALVVTSEETSASATPAEKALSAVEKLKQSKPTKP